MKGNELLMIKLAYHGLETATSNGYGQMDNRAGDLLSLVESKFSDINNSIYRA
jgi:hypothetical protein